MLPTIAQRLLGAMPATLRESITRVLDRVPSQDPLLWPVLLCHLCIEAEIDECLRLSVAKPQALENCRFNFFQRACIAEALRGDAPEVWEMVGVLNTLRNKVAHSLEPPKRAQLLQALERLCNQHEDSTRGATHAFAVKALGDSFEPALVKRSAGDELATVYYAGLSCLGFLAEWKDRLQAAGTGTDASPSLTT